MDRLFASRFAPLFDFLEAAASHQAQAMKAHADFGVFEILEEAGFSERVWVEYRCGTTKMRPRTFRELLGKMSLSEHAKKEAEYLFEQYLARGGKEIRRKRSEIVDRVRNPNHEYFMKILSFLGYRLSDLTNREVFAHVCQYALDPRSSKLTRADTQYAATAVIDILRRKRIRLSDRERVMRIAVSYYFMALTADYADDKYAQADVVVMFDADKEELCNHPLFAYCMSHFPVSFEQYYDQIWTKADKRKLVDQKMVVSSYLKALEAALEIESTIDTELSIFGVGNRVSGAEYNLLKARMFSGEGGSEMIRKRLQEVDDIDRDTGLSAAMRVHNWLGIADSLIQDGKYVEAYHYLNDLVIESHDAIPEFQKARAHYKSGQCLYLEGTANKHRRSMREIADYNIHMWQSIKIFELFENIRMADDARSRISLV